ncbi:4Fe-4S binding protein [Syntrophus aciditrophicus]|uniref:4Fe-4S binding protein n=1 Tax=Syntrophus aciditrophicus TaxID=316277 RepID=UPI0011D043C2
MSAFSALRPPEPATPHPPSFPAPDPVVDADLCRQCGACWTICPARAIDESARPLEFDYDRCIRCCCCIEVCPYGALHTVDPLPGRMIRKLIARFS